MTRQTWLAVLAIGAVALLAGLVLALTGVSRDGQNCGSVFNRTSISAVNANYVGAAARIQADCDAAMSDRKGIAWPLLAVGAVGALLGYVKYHEQAPTSGA